MKTETRIRLVGLGRLIGLSWLFERFEEPSTNPLNPTNLLDLFNPLWQRVYLSSRYVYPCSPSS